MPTVTTHRHTARSRSIQLRGIVLPTVTSHRHAARSRSIQLRSLFSTAIRSRCRRLFQHQMHIGAPHAEGTDSGATRRRAGGPGSGLGIHIEGTGGEIDLRIGRIEIQAGRQAAVPERHHGLDQTGNAGGGIEMPDIGFNRADRAVAAALAVALLAVAALKRLAQGGDLDGIAQRGAGAVRLDIADGLGRDLGHGLGGENDRRLSLDAGRGVTHLGRAVVVHRRAFDHRVDRVARGERLGQAF